LKFFFSFVYLFIYLFGVEIFNICENEYNIFNIPVKGQFKLVFLNTRRPRNLHTRLAKTALSGNPTLRAGVSPGHPSRLFPFFPARRERERERECILQPLAFCCMPCFLGGENGGCCSASLLLCPFSLIDTSFSGSSHGRPFTFGKNREDRPCSLLFRFVVFSSLSL
jgi:hypothetical protein